MSTSLAETLPDASGKAGLRLWLKSSGYARRLLLGAEGDPWVGAAPYLAFFAQAQSLLQPDVAIVEVGDLYRSHLRRHPGLAAEMSGRKRAVYPLRKLLDEEEPRRVLSEVVEAVLAHLRGRMPLVLALPAPRVWLEQAKAAAGLAALQADDEAGEDAAMYVTDLLRSVSSQSIAGVLFEEDSGRELMTAALASYRPLLNIAAHYRWSAVLRGRLGNEVGSAALEGFDALISDGPAPAGLRCLGVDVSEKLWRGEPVGTPGPDQFRFVEIPVGEQPEKVLEALAGLR